KWAGRVVLTVVAMVLAVAGGACAKAIYVDDDAPPGGDGSSWATAYTFLQDALAEAAATEEPVEIRLAQGTYRPDRDAANPAGTGYRTASFFLANETTLRGGYAGLGAPEPDDWDVEAYETILSGDLAGDDVLSEDALDFVEDPNEGNWVRPDVWCPLIESTRQENCLHVVTSRGVGQTAVLEGVTITGGHAYSPPYWFGRSSTVIFGEDDRGGALLHAGGHPTLKACLFVANSAMGGGGAIYSLEGGTLDMEECRCVENFAEFSGGAVFGATDGVLAMRRCQFERNNIWLGSGAAIYTWECQHELVACDLVENGHVGGHETVYVYEASGAVDRCVFSENAGSAVAGSRELVFTDCTFRQNEGSSGAAVYLGGNSNFRFYGCLFLGNEGPRGAVYIGGSPVFVDCCFYGNISTYRGGGALYIGIASPLLSRCHFYGNKSTSHGGAIFAASGNTTIVNCTFCGNQADGKGGVLYARSEGVTSITNSIFWENEASEGFTIAIKESPATVSVSYSLLEGSQVGISFGSNGTLTWGPGNIDADPCFADAGYWDANGTPDDPNDDFFVEGDYHLRSEAGRWDPVSEAWVQDDVTSPCIDGGDPNSPIGYEPFPNGGVINMGAYGGTAEAGKSYFGQRLCKTPIAGDINGDCKVDFKDLVILLNHWLESGRMVEE
ncbi:MAG: right-handed parallel beta-helix repeat-containing protein, partial [Sedimentisphaerales bacterium]|nr:right-handed parallel beta-helix repeat-containing protein [Sedimentisphaerales bacterium]